MARITGYVVGLAIVIRIVRGFFGTKHARFSNFLPVLCRVRDQTFDMIDGSEKRYLGHNPLASITMLTLMAWRAATVLTGWVRPLLIETVRGVGYMMREARG